MSLPSSQYRAHQHASAPIQRAPEHAARVRQDWDGTQRAGASVATPPRITEEPWLPIASMRVKRMSHYGIVAVVTIVVFMVTWLPVVLYMRANLPHGPQPSAPIETQWSGDS